MSQSYFYPPVASASAANQAAEIALLTLINAKLTIPANDYKLITYVGATTDISTVVFRLGGASGTIVATITLGYDGSGRLSTVTQT